MTFSSLVFIFFSYASRSFCNRAIVFLAALRSCSSAFNFSSISLVFVSCLASFNTRPSRSSILFALQITSHSSLSFSWLTVANLASRSSTFLSNREISRVLSSILQTKWVVFSPMGPSFIVPLEKEMCELFLVSSCSTMLSLAFDTDNSSCNCCVCLWSDS